MPSQCGRPIRIMTRVLVGLIGLGTIGAAWAPGGGLLAAQGASATPPAPAPPAGDTRPATPSTSAAEPPLLAAARRGDIATMEKLFLQGEDLNQIGPGRQTALHVAATAAQDKVVAWLISHEASVFAKDES